MRGKDFLTLLEKKNAALQYPDSWTKKLKPFSSTTFFFYRRENRTNYLTDAVLKRYLLMLISSYDFESKMSKEIDLRIDLNSHEDAALNFQRKKEGGA